MMKITDINWKRGELFPELILIAGCWLPLYFVRDDLPELTDHPHDNLWIVQNIAGILNDPFTIWTTLKDPWFRYIPVATVTAIIDLVTTVSKTDIIWITAQFTILLEGLLTPLFLYVLIRLLWTRLAALGAVAIVALTQAFTYPWLTPLPTVLLAPLHHAWYFSPHWQYAWVAPFFLLAFAFASRAAARRYNRSAVLAGIFLGLVASLQVVMAVYSALIIALALAADRRWKELVTVAAVSFLVQLPNLPIILNKWRVWVRMGGGRMNLDVLAAYLTSPLGIGFIAISALAVGIGIVVFRHRDTLTVPLSAPVNSKIDPILLTWAGVTAALFLLCVLIDATWYRRHAAYMGRFAAATWGGIVVHALYSKWMVTPPTPTADAD